MHCQSPWGEKLTGTVGPTAALTSRVYTWWSRFTMAIACARHRPDGLDAACASRSVRRSITPSPPTTSACRDLRPYE